jgi:hypothetical protein
VEPIPCPTCKAVLPADQLADGWCENCGKEIPAFVFHEHPGLAKEVRGLRKAKAGSEILHRTHRCFFCDREGEAKTYYLRFLNISQSLWPGLVVTTRRWADARCHVCGGCTDRVTAIRVWTLALMLFGFMAPLLGCLLIYLPMATYLEAHRGEVGNRPGEWRAVLSAVLGLMLPFVLFVGGIFGGLYLRGRMFARVLAPYSLAAVRDRLGITKIHDISFRDEPRRGSNWLDLTREA